MSARTSGSRLTGIRPDLSAVVRMTKEEGPWKHSPGFSLGWDFNPMVRPERAQELSNTYRSSALTGLSRGRWNSPRLKPGLCFQGPSSFVILTTADRSGRISANGGLLVQGRRQAHLSGPATAIIKASVADKLETVESNPPSLPRSPILPAELRMLDLTTRPH